jgi:uncharacterized membrane protein YphA (DoxX/SURF4 family)
MNEQNYMVGLLIARVFLGVLFFIQGYDKVFKLGLSKVILTFRNELGRSQFPNPVINASAYYTSYAELIGGLCLIFGFMKYYALYALGLDLVMVAVAMGTISPLWKMDFVFPRLILLLLLLLSPPAWDALTADHLISVSSR